MSTCHFYIRKITRSASRMITGNRNPQRPTVHEIKKCTHPESENRPDTIGVSNVTCEGNIEKCVILSTFADTLKETGKKESKTNYGHFR